MENDEIIIAATNLKKHGFEVEVASSASFAKQIILNEIEKLSPNSVSYGDSMTLRSTGIIEELKESKKFIFYDGFDATMPRSERIEIRRKTLLVDIFLSGINAIVTSGELYWQDMVGNRIAAITFGPRKVILIVGRNKIVATKEDAIERIRKIAAPQNAIRHEDFKTPCMITGKCMNCNSPQRICNSTLIMERCFPKERILVIIIDEDLGL